MLELNNVATNGAVNFYTGNRFFLIGNIKINFTQNHSGGINDPNNLFTGNVELGGLPNGTRSTPYPNSVIEIKCDPGVSNQSSSLFGSDPLSSSSSGDYGGQFIIDSGQNTINVNNVDTAFNFSGYYTDNVIPFLIYGGQTKFNVKSGTKKLYASNTDPTFPKFNFSGLYNPKSFNFDLLDNAQDLDLSSLKIAIFKPVKLVTIHTDNNSGFAWNGSTRLRNTISNIGLIYQKPSNGSSESWSINNVSNGVNLADGPSLTNTDITLATQKTPTDEITSKGYTAKSYIYNDNTLDDLKNYKYSDKFNKIEFGTDLYKETDPGCYDVTAADQIVHSGDTDPHDPNDASSKAILSIKDNTITTGDSTQNIDTLKATPDNFNNANKVIQTIAWEPEAIIG